jgi:hypothetical protein
MGLELVAGVSRVMLLTIGPAAAGGGLLAGWPGALGAAAGCLVSLGSFRWLAAAVTRAAVSRGARPGLPLSGLAAGLRHLSLFAALAALLWAGAHPVALLAGLSVLPPALIALALRQARVAR